MRTSCTISTTETTDVPLHPPSPELTMVRGLIYRTLPDLCREDQQLMDGTLDDIWGAHKLVAAARLLAPTQARRDVATYVTVVRDLVRRAAVQYVIQANPKERKPYLSPAQRRLLLGLEDGTPAVQPFSQTLQRLIDLKLVVVSRAGVFETLALTDAGQHAKRRYQEIT